VRSVFLISLRGVSPIKMVHDPFFLQVCFPFYSGDRKFSAVGGTVPALFPPCPGFDLRS